MTREELSKAMIEIRGLWNNFIIDNATVYSWYSKTRLYSYDDLMRCIDRLRKEPHRDLSFPPQLAEVVSELEWLDEGLPVKEIKRDAPIGLEFYSYETTNTKRNNPNDQDHETRWALRATAESKRKRAHDQKKHELKNNRVFITPLFDHTMKGFYKKNETVCIHVSGDRESGKFRFYLKSEFCNFMMGSENYDPQNFNRALMKFKSNKAYYLSKFLEIHPLSGFGEVVEMFDREEDLI